MEDARIKYEQLVEQFEIPDMLDEELIRSQPDSVPPLVGTVVATNVMLEEEGGIKILDGVNFRFDHEAHTAVIGASGSGRAGLVRVLARLIRPTAGTVRIGEHNLVTLSEAMTGRRLAYVDQNAHLFSGTVRDNLYYGLKHRVVRPAEYSGEALAEHRRFLDEAREAGNTTSDVGADWIDYEAAGVDGAEALRTRTVAVLEMTDLKDDIYALGLVGTINPSRRQDLAAAILEARRRLRERLKEPDFARLVEPFDPETYNVNMSVAENLLFGTPIGSEFDLDHLGQNPYMRQVLAKVGLDETFFTTGVRIATIMVELFQDLPSDHEYFERYSFISAEELPEFQQLIRRVETGGTATLNDDERSLLLSLPFKVIAGRHRLGVIDEGIRTQILRARKLFAAELPEGLRGAVAFFDAQAYNAAATIQDNILFGKVVYGRREAGHQIAELIHTVVRELSLENDLLEVGLETQVGISGSRLNSAQGQKIAIARCVLKRPDILIVNDATAALDPASQVAIANGLFGEFKGRGVIWVVSRPENVPQFDHAIVMEGGKVEEYGKIAELNQPGRALHALLNGN